jgi:hypothetical protein
MAFHVINPLSKFGPQLSRVSRDLQQAKDNLDLQVARITEMSDAQWASEYGITTLTRTQALSTLTAAQTQLEHSSIIALVTQIG